MPPRSEGPTINDGRRTNGIRDEREYYILIVFRRDADEVINAYYSRCSQIVGRETFSQDEI